jgi:Spy/CpxP family protein refolding chaperone
MAPSSTHHCSISYMATRTEWDKKRNCIMKAKVIVAFLLSIVTASEPALTAVRRQLPNDEPPRLPMVGVSTDNANALADPNTSSTGEVVLVAMPFSSLQLNPILVEYLGLTRTQAKAIQKLMDHERPTTEPLMDELRTVSAELGVAIRQNQSNDNEGVAQSLAATQARLLKQLMRANSRLQLRIDEVLGPQQRKKLDALRHKAEVSVVHGS